MADRFLFSAFLSWISHKNLAPSTQEVSKTIWGKFSKWMVGKGIHLYECNAEDMMAFNENNELIE